MRAYKYKHIHHLLLFEPFATVRRLPTIIIVTIINGEWNELIHRKSIQQDGQR